MGGGGRATSPLKLGRGRIQDRLLVSFSICPGTIKAPIELRLLSIDLKSTSPSPCDKIKEGRFSLSYFATQLESFVEGSNSHSV